MFDLEKSIVAWRKQMLAAGIQAPVPLNELEIHLREEIERQMKSGSGGQKSFEVAVEKIGRAETLKTEFKKNGALAGQKTAIFTLTLAAVMISRVLYMHHITGPVWKNDQLGWILFTVIISFWAVNTLLFDFKLGEVREVRLWKLVGITFSIFAVWVSLLPVLPIFIVPKFNAAFGTMDRLLVLAAAVTSILSVFGWQSCRGILPIIRDRRWRTLTGIACCIAGPGTISVILYVYVVPRMGQFHTSVFYVTVAWAWTAMAVLGGVGYGLTEAARSEPTVAGS